MKLNKPEKKIASLRIALNIFIVLAIGVTPFVYSSEWKTLLTGRVLEMSTPLTDLFIKASKEFFTACILFCALGLAKSRVSIIASIPIVFLLAFSVVIGFFSSDNTLVYLSGLRWIFPLFLLVSLIGIPQELEIRVLRNSVFLVFLVSFAVQIMQTRSYNPTFGLTAQGFSERSAGIFTAPINAGILAVSTSLLVWVAPFKKQLTNIIVILLVLASVLLTRSGTALIGVFFFIVMRFCQSIRLKIAPAIIMSSVVGTLVLVNLPFITSRSTILSTSGGTRLGILSSALDTSNFLYGNFGQYSNTALLISSVMGEGGPKGVIADSMITSLVGNVGILLAVLMISLFAILAVLSVLSSNYAALTTSVLLLFFSLSVNLTESFPAYLVFAILIAYQIPQLVPIRVKVRVHSG
ncbi:MAG: hypothetical protein EOO45_00025 [Flavobacterium sp.]|nr:MAG: hypothetical protein EOO45_00025 [Flavobacterium sp.]